MSESDLPECPICQDKLAKELVTTPCGHVFHNDCINQAIFHNQKCPYCRKQVLVSQVISLHFNVESKNKQNLEQLSESIGVSKEDAKNILVLQAKLEALNETNQKLKKQNEDLQDTAENFKRTNQTLQELLESQKSEYNRHKNENFSLKIENEQKTKELIKVKELNQNKFEENRNLLLQNNELRRKLALHNKLNQNEQLNFES